MVLSPVQSSAIKVRQIVRRDHPNVPDKSSAACRVLGFLRSAALLEVDASPNSLLSRAVPSPIPWVVVETVEGMISRVSVMSMMTMMAMTMIPVFSMMLNMMFLFLLSSLPGCRPGLGRFYCCGCCSERLQWLSKQFHPLTNRIPGIILTKILALSAGWVCCTVRFTPGILSGESHTICRTFWIEWIFAARTSGILANKQFAVWNL